MTWYHGTRKPFRGKGGLVMPRASHGGEGTTAPLMPGRSQPDDAADWVYVTSNVDLAWVYAWHAPGRGKPRVLDVDPMGRLDIDPEHSGAMEAARCEAAIVRAVLTEPTMTEKEAREGWLIS